MASEWLLDGKDAISRYLNNASDYMLKKWLEDGMPVKITGGRWIAHSQNIEDFFKTYTRTRASKNDIESIVKKNNV